MSNKSRIFNNHDLRVGSWYIPGGALITEVAFEANKKRQVTAVIPKDIPLGKDFRVINPASNDEVADHICFEYTNQHGTKTHVYVHEDQVLQKPDEETTWTDRNRFI